MMAMMSEWKGGGKGWKGDDKGKGKGKKEKGWVNTTGADYSNHKYGTYYEEPGGVVGIEGLKDAVTRALAPFEKLEADGEGGMPEVVNDMCTSIYKTATKWYKDNDEHKNNHAGSNNKAKALLEQYVHKALGNLQNKFYDKAWMKEIYLSECLALAALHTFKIRDGGLFKRTCAPSIVTYVNQAIFDHREEERIQNVLYESLKAIPLKDSYEKKANKHLQASYDVAHAGAEYGSTSASSPQLGLIQDFVLCWMNEFGRRGWDVLDNGVEGDKVQVMVSLFHYLTAPEHSVLPHDLQAGLSEPLGNKVKEFIAAEVPKIFVEPEPKEAKKAE